LNLENSNDELLYLFVQFNFDRFNFYIIIGGLI